MKIGSKVGSTKKLKKQMERAKAQAERTFIKFIPADQILVVRFLDEPTEWYQYGEHFDQTGQLGFYPCVGVENDCEGCLQGNKPSKKFLVRALDVDSGGVIPLKLPVTLVNRLATRFDRRGTLTDRDFELFREGKGLDTSYDYEALEKDKLDLSRYKELDLEQILVDEWDATFGEDDDDDEEDEAPRARRLRSSRRSKRRRTSRDEDDYDDDDEDEDEDEEEEERPRRRSSSKTKARKSSGTKKRRRPEPEEDEDEDYDDEEEEEEPPRRRKSSTSRKRRRPEPEEDEDDDEDLDEEDEDEEPEPPRRRRRRARDDEDEDDEDDEDAEDDEEETITEEELRAMPRLQVKRVAKELGIEHKPREHTNTIIEKILDAAGE